MQIISEYAALEKNNILKIFIYYTKSIFCNLGLNTKNTKIYKTIKSLSTFDLFFSRILH